MNTDPDYGYPSPSTDLFLMYGAIAPLLVFLAVLNVKPILEFIAYLGGAK